MPGEVIDRGDDFTPTNDAEIVDAKLGKPAVPTAADEAAAAALTAEKAAETAAAEAAAAAKEGETPKAGEEGKAKPKDTRLPLARHQEILDKERERRAAVETELAQYKQGGKIADVGAEITAAETNLIALEATYAKHLTDGEHEKAAALMAQIRRTERAIIEKSSAVREQAAEARAVERVRYDTTVERLEAQFPQLNVEHEDFDKAKTAEVLELKEAFQTKGYTPSAALQKAVKLIMPPETKKQEAALETEARVDPKEVEKARKAAAVEKTAAAVAATPANAAKVGANSDAGGGGAVTAKDVIKMSFKDFSALDETTLARMRGDVI
jgi:hypothetical protein